MKNVSLKYLRYLTCILLFLPVLSEATVKISVVDGNAAIATNWSPPGVPNNSDTIVVLHDMIFGSNVNIGNTGVLTVKSSGSLSLGSNKLDITGKVINEGRIDCDEVDVHSNGILLNCDTIVASSRIHIRDLGFMYNSYKGFMLTSNFDPHHSGVVTNNDGLIKATSGMDLSHNVSRGYGNYISCGNVNINDGYIYNELDFCSCDGFTDPLQNTANFLSSGVTVCNANILEPQLLKDDFDTVFVNLPSNIRILDNDTINILPLDTLTLDTSGLVRPANGTLAFDLSNGNVTYTPDSGYVGTDSFQYSICDTFCTCDTAFVYITLIYYPTEVSCTNGFDDDNDGLTDCDDDECKPATPAAITPSNNTICQDAANETYTIAPVIGAISYTWSVPLGSSITSGQGTTSITVSWGNTQGQVTVVSNDGTCDSDPSSLLINMIFNPDDPGSITHN